ncbi:MAG: AcrR family transcriptional regulator [Cryomorphaceae bacterium]|jgi:AcrR family transcriptional regulator
MKTLPTQDRAIQKREALILAAVSEFSGMGFEVATAKSIAARAGVATGTFYQYFDNKNDILRIIAEQRYAHLEERIKFLELSLVDSESCKPKLDAMFISILTFVYDFHALEQELHRVLEQRRAVDSELKQIMQQGESVLLARVRQFVGTFNLPNADIVAENLFAMGEGLVHRLVFETSSKNAEQIIKVGAGMLASFFIHAVPIKL